MAPARREAILEAAEKEQKNGGEGDWNGAGEGEWEDSGGGEGRSIDHELPEN
jgi:hypothetical protein